MDFINKIEIRFLEYSERKVLKGIRLNKQIGDRHVWAELLYTRDILPNYVPQYVKEKTEGGLFFNSKIIFPQDDYDDMVLSAVKKEYPDAQMTCVDVNTDSCIERLRKMYEGYSKETAIVYLSPDLSHVDPFFVPIGSRYTQFMEYFDIYTPCPIFLDYFKNEGYFFDYNLADAEKIDKMLEIKKPTVHHIEELWS